VLSGGCSTRLCELRFLNFTAPTSASAQVQQRAK